MFGSTVLEVAIGLVFLYLSLSLICSALNEYYSALVSRRARHLKDSLFSLFNKDDPRGITLLVEFFSHPLIGDLVPNAKKPATGDVSAMDRTMPTGLSGYQSAILGFARSWADWKKGIGRHKDSILGTFRWTADAFRDPYRTIAISADEREKLIAATRSMPPYIPDRSFSEALFAVLAGDSYALSLVRDELTNQLASLAGIDAGLADPAKTGFSDALASLKGSLDATASTAKTLQEFTGAVIAEFNRLRDTIPENLADQGSVAARTSVEKARDAVVASGPGSLSADQLRDRVLTALESSLRRLAATFASLPDSPMKANIQKKLEEVQAGVASARSNPVELEVARKEARRALDELKGTIDGQIGQVDWSKAAGWFAREAAAFAASEGNLITIARLRGAVKALPESDIRSALLSQMDEVGDDLDRVKRNIQGWYNDSMERVSGWYKRNTQLILAIIAIGLAGILNADTIAIAERLWSDSTLRASVTAVAGAVDPAKLGRPPTDNPTEALDESAAARLNESVRTMLRESDLPLGWTRPERERFGLTAKAIADVRKFQFPALDPSKTEIVLVKLLGLFLTAVATSMGAPFWFDVLNKLVNVRATGQQPKKSEDRPSPAATSA